MLVRTSSQILEHMESEIEVSPRKKLGCNPQSFSKETHLMNLWVDSAFNSWSIYIYIYLDTDTYTYTYTFTCYISVYVCIYIYTYRLVSSWISFDGSYSSSMFFFCVGLLFFGDTNDKLAGHCFLQLRCRRISWRTCSGGCFGGFFGLGSS